MNKTHTNNLVHETSPYLLQHAHNPVNWYAWGDEALQKAKLEDKPILISIGYSACHWCHVMERESFEDEETAAIMNKYFVNIKVDREERPDLDHIYMDAVQAIAGNGGWPLNVFLTPEGKPFYGGTYFPPIRAYNRSSWKEVLEAIHLSFIEKREEIESQADNLVNHLVKSNAFGINAGNAEAASFFTEDNLQLITEGILKNADTVWGGFGNAPKFPQTFCVQYLLRQYYFTGNEAGIKQALLSLDKMLQGGIYDQLGGGFSRYSTDAKWLAPHFEKMLYDNALLLGVYSEAYQLTRNEEYAFVIRETIGFIEREMLSPEYGFFSALDADSEGVEGKYYTWSKDEIDEILGADSNLFCDVFNVTEQGNWEHTNILWLPESIKQKALALKIDEANLRLRLKNCSSKLMAYREKRIRPQLDDKILLGWNALMIVALCKAYAALNIDTYLVLAEKNIQFLEINMQAEAGAWHHTWKNGEAKYPAFLDDYAFLIQAYIHLQEVTGNQQYLLKAEEITEFVIEHFSEPGSGYFYFTALTQKDIVVRKKEVYDGATPSGNSVMAGNLFYLGTVFDLSAWIIQSKTMIQSLGNAVTNYPISFAFWASMFQNLIYGVNEIVVTGNGYLASVKQLINNYIPNKIIQSSVEAQENFPFFRGKLSKEEKTKIYLCKNYTCKAPVENVEELLLLL